MTIIEAAILEVTALLDQLDLPYMLIGGIAVGLWGEPRATLDVDLTVWVETDQFGPTIDALIARLEPRLGKPREFAVQNRVLPVRASNGVPVDLLFAAWPIEQRAIQAAVSRHVGGAEVRVAGLDFLMLLKLISERPKDFADAEALFRRHRAALDLSWLEAEINALAEAIAQPEMSLRFRRLTGGE